MRSNKGRIFVLTLLSVCLFLPLQGQDTSRQTRKKQNLEKEITLLEGQIRENEAKSKDVLEKFTLTGKLVSSRKALVAETDRELRSTDGQIAVRRRNAEQMRQRVDTLDKYYSRLLVSAYKSRNMSSWYVYILASESLGQAYRRYSYFRTLSDNLKSQAFELKEARVQLQDEMDSLSRLRSRQQQLRNERARDLSRLQKEEKDYSRQMATLKKNKNKYTAETARKRREVERLDKEIERIVNSAVKAPPKKSQPVDYVLDGEFSKNKGKLPWPAEGSIVEKYGQHYHPVFTNVKMPFNKGINIAVAQGAPVRAVFDGTVTQVVVIPGYNLCGMLRHGNYFTFYCKLKSTQVKVGDKVKTGQQLGTVDTVSGASRLHFELWKGSQHQNPENWLRP